MRVILSIDLDETWDQYRDMPVEFLIEDIFAYPEKEGIKDVNVIDICDV